MKNFLFSKKHSGIPANVVEHIISRIENILLELKQVFESSEIEAYIS